MIGYRISLRDLRKRITKTKPRWLSRARQRTNALAKLGLYAEDKAIWGEIKSVYFELQGGATIHLFDLDNVDTRSNLALERARGLTLLYLGLEKLSDPSQAGDPVAQQVVAAALSAKAPHTNCNRSFKRLFDHDPAAARQIYQAAAAFVSSKS